MKHVLLLTAAFSCFFIGIGLHAQAQVGMEHKCGTTFNVERQRSQARFVLDYEECNAIKRKKRTLQVTIFIAHDSLGTTNVLMEDIDDALERLNNFWEPIGIDFVICDTVHMPNFQFDDFYDEDHLEDMLAMHYRPQRINVFLCTEVEVEGFGPAGGFASMPGGRDYMVLRKSTMNAFSNVWAHEMGHFFGLFHTFETSFGDELVDASNCITTGDLVCDTGANPTDEAGDFDPIPGISCNYIGEPATDANGDFYIPPADNIMSYSPCGCRFTPGQYNRMLQQYVQNRSYLW